MTGVFEFEDWITRDRKIVYFPVFGSPTSEPISVLSEAQVEFEVHGKTVGIVTPCDAPAGMKETVSGTRIFWFSANLDDLVDIEEPLSSDDRMVVRFSDTQRLIHGRFYYLPIIPGGGTDEQSWRYQMFVRSESRAIRIVSKNTDYFPLADAVIVHLKDRSIVEMQ